MDGFTNVIIALIVIGFPSFAIFAIVSRVYRHREKKLELEAQIAASQRGSGNSRLEERVRVLERIVTTKGHLVADEIERLRAPTD